MVGRVLLGMLKEALGWFPLASLLRLGQLWVVATQSSNVAK